MNTITSISQLNSFYCRYWSHTPVFFVESWPLVSSKTCLSVGRFIRSSNSKCLGFSFDRQITLLEWTELYRWCKNNTSTTLFVCNCFHKARLILIYIMSYHVETKSGQMLVLYSVSFSSIYLWYVDKAVCIIIIVCIF